MEEKYWDSFETSGKIEDYLRYKGIQNKYNFLVAIKNKAL